VPLARHLMPLCRYSGTVESDMVDGKKPRSRTRGRRAHEPDAADREAPALRRDPNRHQLPARKAAPAPSRPTALTERAADLRAASMKTPSYPTASRRWRARLLHAVALAPCEGQRQLPAKCPPFEPIFPPFDHDRPDDDLTARTADRAVLYKLRRFLAGIHAILKTPDKREVGRSILPNPILDSRDSGGSDAPNQLLSDWRAEMDPAPRPFFVTASPRYVGRPTRPPPPRSSRRRAHLAGPPEREAILADARVDRGPRQAPVRPRLVPIRTR